MKSIHPVLKFVLIFSLVYGILMIRWPGLDSAYQGMFNSVNEKIFGNFGKRGIVRFSPLDENPVMTKIRLADRNKANPATGNVDLFRAYILEPRYIGFIGMALIIALVAASPVSPKRKFMSLALGIAAINLFVLMKVYFILLSRFNSAEPYGIYQYGPGTTRFLNSLSELLMINIGPTLLFATGMWLLLTFRKDDFEKLKSLLETTVVRQPSAAKTSVGKNDRLN